MTLLRYFPLLVRDRVGRLGLLLGAAMLLAGPHLVGLRAAARTPAVSGLRDGLSVTADAHPLSGPIGLMLGAGALLLWEGIVARGRREGTFRTILARPISRPGYFLACYLASLVCLAVAGLALGAASTWAASGLGRPLSLSGAVLVAGGYALAIGSPIFLASTWLDRGDALLVVPLALAPSTLARLAEGHWAGGAERAIPVLRLLLPPIEALDAMKGALFAGHVPPAGSVLLVVGYGLALLAAAVLVIRYGEFRSR